MIEKEGIAVIVTCSPLWGWNEENIVTPNICKVFKEFPMCKVCAEFVGRENEVKIVARYKMSFCCTSVLTRGTFCAL